MDLTNRQGALLWALSRAGDDGADLVLQSIDPGGSGPWRFGEADSEWISDADLRSLGAYLFVRLMEEPGNGTIHVRIEPQGRLASERILSVRQDDDQRRLFARMRPVDHAPTHHAGVPVPGDLRPNWNQPEAYWWRKGVEAALEHTGSDPWTLKAEHSAAADIDPFEV